MIVVTNPVLQDSVGDIVLSLGFMKQSCATTPAGPSGVSDPEGHDVGLWKPKMLVPVHSIFSEVL